MDNDFSQFLGGLAGLGIILVVVWFVFTVLLVILAIWIQYTIMWRAVRRGMREFHRPGGGAPMMQQTPYQPVAPPAQ